MIINTRYIIGWILGAMGNDKELALSSKLNTETGINQHKRQLRYGCLMVLFGAQTFMHPIQATMFGVW